MILLLTYAKVCTTSLHQLLANRFPGDVYRSHGLEAWILDPLERFVAAANTDTTGLVVSFDNDPIRSRLAQARATGESITIISGVRDPISRSLSVAMQNLEAAFADCICPMVEATAQAIANRVADLWQHDTTDGDPIRNFCELMIRAPFSWFEQEIHAAFGFDLRAHQFDHTRGYSILSKGNIRLLLFRYESAPSAIENGLTQLFPEIDVALPIVNRGQDKQTEAVYNALKRNFRLPRSTLEAIYAHPDVRAYYSAGEIDAAIDRWAEPAPRHEWVLPPLPAALHLNFAATVFIPVRNNAHWIGELIDSLIAQWRPDLELLLVDDGSEDNSLDVALDRLAGHPEVAATVMRNNRAIGHGMLPNVVSLSRAPVLIQADSDDIALPGRIDAILHQFDTHPDCRLVTSNAVLLSETGLAIGLLDFGSPDVVINDPVSLADQQNNIYWLGASSAFHRSVIEDFAPLDPELCAYGLDLLTGFRATLLGSQRYLARPLVGWRQHSKNSHRIIGAHSRDAASQEHLAAILLMTRAQRLRDLSWLEAKGKLSRNRAAEVEARWRADYMEQADTWIRLRNRLTGTHAAPTPRGAGGSQGEVYVPAVPPILTLLRGVEYSAPQMAQVLHRWGGMHSGDTGMVWTSRQVVIALRIPDPGAQGLVVALAGMPYVDRQSVSLSLDFSPPVLATVIAGELKRVTVPITTRRDTVRGIMTLMVIVPEAAMPVSFDPANADQRILGVALFAMQVI